MKKRQSLEALLSIPVFVTKKGNQDHCHDMLLSAGSTVVDAQIDLLAGLNRQSFYSVDIFFDYAILLGLTRPHLCNSSALFTPFLFWYKGALVCASGRAQYGNGYGLFQISYTA